MSESYTVGGDTLAPCDNPNRQGQTFTPLETHILEYIDLEMRGGMVIPTPVILVYKADAWHNPIGNYISRNRYVVEKKCSRFAVGRARFSMQSVELVAGEYYVIIAENYPPIGGSGLDWQYNNGSGTYPRGIRISSSNGGASWLLHPNDDFMFSEFGTPPLPKADPPPPIDNFAVINLIAFHNPNSIVFTIATSVPAHLTLYYTPHQPLKHHTTRVVRGLSVPWRTYFCFVGWQFVEQQEEGDTLYHTFEVPDWSYCQTKWFTFRGEVDSLKSPSIGPIFKYHHPGVTYGTIILRPNANGDICFYPWQIGFPCPDHWKNVNDIFPDENTSMVYGHDYPVMLALREYYNIDDPPVMVNPISRLTLTCRARISNPGRQVPSLTIGYRISGVDRPYGIFQCTTSWRDYEIHRSNNPVTGVPWTWDDLKTLQLGIGLGWPMFPRSTNEYTYCTQVFIEVRYYL